MDESHLRETLTEIHRELGQAESVDESSRDLLVQVLHDIERLLGSDTTSPPPQQRGQALLGQLRTSVEHFEESHPFLASLIARIADGLSNMGI